MTTIVHGSPFTVSGANFGTKSGSAPNLWDDCSHGQAWSVRWDRRWHDVTDAPYEEDYRDPSNYPAGNGLALPHSRATKVLCGTHNSIGADGSDVRVSKDYTRPSATSWWTVISYYFRVNPSAAFGGDNNFKQHFMSGGGSFSTTGTYAYIEFQNSGWTSNSTTGFEISWHDAALIGSVPQFTDTGAYPSNPCQKWQKVELVINYKTSAGGLWKWRVDQTQVANVSLQTHDASAYRGATWQEDIGGFSRSRGADNVRYFCDIYRDVQLDHPGRFYLTDSATWGSETINEIQRWSGSWTPTSVPLVCNAGGLSNGTVHLHYRDEVNGDQYLGTFTLADSGGGGLTIDDSAHEWFVREAQTNPLRVTKF